MITDVKKHLFIGAQEVLDAFFEMAQQKGFLEFIPPTARRPMVIPSEIQELMAALKILRKLPVKHDYVGSHDLSTAAESVARILELKRQIDDLDEQKRLLQGEIVRVAPFGDFSTEDLDYIEKEGKREIQFFCMMTSKARTAVIPDELIYIATEYDLDYFIALSTKHKSYPGMIEMRIDRPLGDLQTHLAFAKESLQQLEAELKGYAGHHELLHEALVARLNEFHLASAKQAVSHPIEKAVFAVEAWIPESKIQALYTFIEKMPIHCEQIAIEETDRAPTCMENKGVSRVGEDLVKIYDIPATTDKDPSSWVFWAFALFFAMIVADGGYGLLYLGTALFLKFKYKNMRGFGKRFIKLAIILSSACVLWGLFTTSFFGLQIDPKGPVGKFSLIQYLAAKKGAYHWREHDDVQQYWLNEYPELAPFVNGRDILECGVKRHDGHVKYEILDTFSDNILLELSLVIGILHLSLSFLRYLFRNWAGIGWVAFMIGSYFYFPSMLSATTMVHYLGWLDKDTAHKIGLQLVYSGIGVALVLALIQNRLKGLGEIANLVQVFADVLSYLRLYALGLAGSIMAATFNDMGQAVGLFFGLFVILIGHSINILLGLMAGVIHGLRLNFIEWYHFCFTGGGRLFKPLARLKR